MAKAELRKSSIETGEAWRRLSVGGYFLLETGEYHSGAAQAELARQGFADITAYADLNGLPRVIRARRTGKACAPHLKHGQVSKPEVGTSRPLKCPLQDS